jgi:hypothetical protein
MMLEHEVSHPADEIPAFRLIDVVDNRLVRGVSKSKYAALSYVVGRNRIHSHLEGKRRHFRAAWRIEATGIS